MTKSNLPQLPTIDYVIPFVDGSDKNWLMEYKKYVSGPSDSSNNATRFRDWDTLRYQLRSIERNMPWIRNIFIVMSISETQIPDWLDTQNKRIRIVWDWEIVPRKYLPVFNSNAIDLYIPRIAGLSERYLYACDDYIVMRELKPEKFFSDKGIRLQVGFYLFNIDAYAQTICNSGRLICPELVKKEGERYLMPYCHHAIVPHLRSEDLAIMRKYQKEINSSLSRFREGKNLTWLIYPLYLARKGLLEQGNIITRYNALFNVDSIRKLDFEGCDVVVLNDEYCDDFLVGKPLLINRLEDILPGKSEFEK